MSSLLQKVVNQIPRPFQTASRFYLENEAKRAERSQYYIPDAISFEKVVANKSSPPVALINFMDYMVYVQQEAENLQFFLWLQDYENRFEQLPSDSRSLSPSWEEASNTSFVEAGSTCDISAQCDEVILPTAESRLQLYTSQPFRPEITRIVVNYLAPGGVRELRLSKEDRLSILRGLQHTTHPSVFRKIRHKVLSNVKQHSHPKFIKWAMANSNKPHRAGGYVLAALLMLAAIAGLTICFLYSAPRPYRLLTSLPIALAIFVIVSLMARICPVYYLLSHTRELPPWQLYQNSAINSTESCGTIGADDQKLSSDKGDMRVSDIEKGSWSLDLARSERMDPLGPRNKWNEEPWIQMYQKRPIWRKLFDKSDTVKEKGLILVLRRVLKQSLIWSVCVTTVWTVGVISVPS